MRIFSARPMDSEEQLKAHNNLLRLTHDEASSGDEDSEHKENSEEEQSSDGNESSSSSSADNDEDCKQNLTTHYQYQENVSLLQYLCDCTVCSEHRRKSKQTSNCTDQDGADFSRTHRQPYRTDQDGAEDSRTRHKYQV